MDALFVLAQWIPMLAILFLTASYGRDIVKYSQPREQRISARAGFLAGLLLLVIFVAFDSKRQPEFGWSSQVVTEPSLLIIILSAMIGFGFLWLISKLIPTRLVGLITLLLSAGSTIGMYSFIFMSSLRATILSTALGAAFGSLVHVIFFPSTFNWRAAGIAAKTKEKGAPREAPK